MAILAVNFVLPRMQLVGEGNRLFRLIPLLDADGEQSIDHGFESNGCYDKTNQKNKSTALNDGSECKGCADNFFIFFGQLLLIEVFLKGGNDQSKNHNQQD